MKFHERTSLNMIMLKLSLLVSLLLVVALGGEVNTGNFKTAEDSECSWFEKRYGGDVRGFALSCECPGEHAKVSYSCEYKGDLEECRSYHKRPADFWKQLVKYFSCESQPQ